MPTALTLPQHARSIVAPGPVVPYPLNVLLTSEVPLYQRSAELFVNFECIVDKGGTTVPALETYCPWALSTQAKGGTTPCWVM